MQPSLYLKSTHVSVTVIVHKRQLIRQKTQMEEMDGHKAPQNRYTALMGVANLDMN